MTGIEALNKLKEGNTLRRSYWEDDQKCKALDFFGEWIVFFPKEQKENISDEELKEILTSNNWKLVPLKFNELFDTVGAGEFLHDDWEIIN